MPRTNMLLTHDQCNKRTTRVLSSSHNVLWWRLVCNHMSVFPVSNAVDNYNPPPQMNATMPVALHFDDKTRGQTKTPKQQSHEYPDARSPNWHHPLTVLLLQTPTPVDERPPQHQQLRRL
jgi:hypothetical protein